MDILSKLFLFTHIIAGFSSLALFWVPVFTRKGGLNHRRVGKLYVRMMWAVVITAMLLSVENLVTGNTVMAVFLGFLSLLTARPLFLGIEVLNNKKKVSSRFRQLSLLMNLMIVLAGIALIAYGVSLGGEGIAVFMFIFGGLGVANIFALITSLKNPSDKLDWMKEHISGMCVSGIAAHTAFLAFGAQSFISEIFSSYWSIVPWVTPTIVGTIGIQIAVRRYQKNAKPSLV